VAAWRCARNCPQRADIRTTPRCKSHSAICS
jgi:hypothetical protein